MATDIRVRGVKAWAADREALDRAGRELYAGAFAAVSGSILAMEPAAAPVGEVSEAVLRALTEDPPATRYPVGPYMDQIGALQAMPDRERDKFALGILGLQ